MRAAYAQAAWYVRTRGVVRASVSCVTTKQECYEFLNAVETISKNYKKSAFTQTFYAER